MNTVDATASGLPYPVMTVAGEPPSGLDQFVGEVEFRILKSGAESAVHGVGARSDDSVRFSEKTEGSGKDVRVWQIRAGNGGGFVATSMATF